MNIKERIKSKKSLFESFFSLSILNGVNILLPLLTLPYILRVVGAANYGTYAYVYAIISYLLLISNYGFNFSATKQIAQNRDNKKQIDIIYNSVIVSRLLLTLAGTIFFAALSFILLDNADKQILFILGLGIVLGDVFNPVWLFQGMEKMRYMTIVNALSKIIFTMLIFIIVSKADDFRYLTLINSFGFLLAGLTSTIIAKKQFGISFFLPKLKDVKFQIKEGATLFGTSVGTNLYGNANVFILNFFVGESSLGIYAAAEKIIKALQTITSPITQALFPYIGNDFRNRPIAYKLAKIKKLAFVIFIILIVPNLIIFFGANTLVQLFGGVEFKDSATLLKVMSPVIIIGTMNYVLGVIGLVNLNKQKLFFLGVMIAGVVSVIFLMITIPHWGVLSASIAIPLSELVLFTFCIIIIARLKQKSNE